MQNIVTIVDSPDRENIKLCNQSINSNQSIEATFGWLLCKMESMGKDMDRYVIFCKSINDCAKIYLAFIEEFGKRFPLVQMYHSKTDDVTKEKIRKDMEIETGNVRVLICTNAAGMGVNYKALHNVIHYGPPQELDTFVQQMGRAGRDGVESRELLIYNKRQLRNTEKDMLSYVRSSTCRRQNLMDSYNVKADTRPSDHTCCDICTSSCECESCACISDIQMVSDRSDEHEDMIFDSDDVSDREKRLIRSHLELYRDSFADNMDNQSSATLINQDLIHGFSLNVIDDIIAKCYYLCSPDDVMQHVHVWSFKQAKSVYEIIHCVLYEEDMAELSDGYMSEDD
jgi:ATP-dependent DNA helicase RecQ